MLTNNKAIPVWDIGVRLFHWLLVVSFIIAYASSEQESLIHIYSGYMVLALITFRLLWGFMGSKHARFSDFLYPPDKILSYLKSLISGNPEHYSGHNPAGGLMVMFLLISLFMVTISGLKLYAVEEGKGPLAAQMNTSIVSTAHADGDRYEHDNDDDDHEYRRYERYKDDEYKSRRYKNEDESEEFWEEIHEASTHFTVFLIVLHIFGVFISSKLHNENLIKAMITGKKNK